MIGASEDSLACRMRKRATEEDYATADFLGWFVKEQAEEEALASDTLAKNWRWRTTVASPECRLSTGSLRRDTRMLGSGRRTGTA